MSLHNQRTSGPRPDSALAHPGTEVPAAAASRAQQPDGGGRHRPVVLHVVEAFGGGVAAAVRDYARATPECEHHLLCHLRPEAVNLEASWDADFSSVRTLPGGHLANIKATRWAIREVRPDVVHSHSSYAGVYARLAVGHLPRRRNDTLSPLNAPGAPTTRAERHGDLLGRAELAPSGRGEAQDAAHDAARAPLVAPARSRGAGARVPAPVDRALRELANNRYLDLSLSRIKQVYTPHAWSFSRLDRSRFTRLGYWVLEGVLAARTDVLAGCSKAENNVAHWGPISPHTVYVPNIAHPYGAPKPHPEPGEPLVLAGAGRLAAQKDPVFFVRTVEAIRAAGHRVAPLWIGGGDGDVEQLLREHGVEVTGWVGHDEVREHLRRADVYLHTARWEGFPITVLEAALNDIPVIVRRIRVFDDAGLPVVVDSPEDVARRWEEITDERAREEVSAWARRALWENCYAVQRRRLGEIYGVRVPLVEPADAR